MDFSYAQKAMMAVGLMVSGTLSLICNGFIVYKIYLRHREYRKTTGLAQSSYQMTTYHRLLLGMSTMDILHSFANAVGTLVVPASTGVVFGHGTLATCAAQGFFFQFGFAMSIYTASLTTFFMLKIRYNMHDVIMTRRYEPWFHIIPLLFGFTFAIVGVSLKLYNPIIIPEQGCWVSAYPAGCMATGTCSRGFGSTNAAMNDVLLWGYGFSWLVTSFLVVVVNSILIFTAIKGQETRIAKYQIAASSIETKPCLLVANTRTSHTTTGSSIILAGEDNASDPVVSQELFYEGVEGPDVEVGDEINESSSNAAVTTMFERSVIPREPVPLINGRKQIKASRVAAVQCSLFCASTFLTAIWILMPWVEYKIDISTRTAVVFAFMSNIFAPSQGIFNLFIFIRLQYIKLRETHTDWSRFKCLVYCLTSPASDK